MGFCERRWGTDFWAIGIVHVTARLHSSGLRLGAARGGMR